MKFAQSLALVALVLCQFAVASIETLVRAVETAPINIRFPAADNGVLTFRPCGTECDDDYVRVALNAETTYRLNGKVVKFGEFRQQFMLGRGGEGAYALVTYDIKAGTLAAIEFAQ